MKITAICYNNLICKTNDNKISLNKEHIFAINDHIQQSEPLSLQDLSDIAQVIKTLPENLITIIDQEYHNICANILQLKIQKEVLEANINIITDNRNTNATDIYNELITLQPQVSHIQSHDLSLAQKEEIIQCLLSNSEIDFTTNKLLLNKIILWDINVEECLQNIDILCKICEQLDLKTLHQQRYFQIKQFYIS